MPLFADIGFDFSSAFLVNEARVTRQGGATVIASSATRPVGIRSKSLTVETQTDAQAAAIAQRIITLFAAPLRRVVRLDLGPTSDPNTVAVAVLTDVLGSRIRATFTPVGGGAAFTQDALIDQISHTITVDAWRASYALNSAEAT